MHSQHTKPNLLRSVFNRCGTVLWLNHTGNELERSNIGPVIALEMLFSKAFPQALSILTSYMMLDDERHPPVFILICYCVVGVRLSMVEHLLSLFSLTAKVFMLW